MVDSAGNYPCNCGSGKNHPYSGAHGGNDQQAHSCQQTAAAGTRAGTYAGRNRGRNEDAGGTCAGNLKEQLEEVLGTLTEREQKVLTLRFGLEDGRARTLEEVGKEFNVTRERIRQIEAKALRKLRHPSRSRKLKDYLE